MGKHLWYVPPRPPHSFPRALFHPLPAAMNARLSLLAAALVSAILTSPATGATLPFTETFDDNDVAWNHSSGGTPSTDNAGWSWSSSTYKAKHAVRLGKTKGEVGSTTTPSLFIPSAWSKASVTVSFQAAAWYGCSSGLTLSKIENGLTAELDSWSVPQIAANLVDATNNVADLSAFTSDANGKPYTATFEARDSFQLVFATTGTGNNCRSYLDTVVVTAEEIVSTLTTLPAPANLDTNALSYTGFSLVWDEVSGATGYVVRVDGDVVARCPPETKTASVTGLAAGGTYAVTVIAQGDGITTEDSPAAPLSVSTPAYPATIVPDPMSSSVSSSAFTVSWTQHPNETYSVLAWTNIPANVASQNFANYAANGTVPEGWIFKNSHNHYPNENAPVDFRADGNWIASPEFGGPVESVSFYIAAAGSVTNSHFFVYGTTGTTNREDWVLLNEVTDSETGTVTTEQKTLSVFPSAGIKRIIFEYQKNQGNVRIGTFSVTGTDVGESPVYLPGYGPSPTDVNTTSVTFANPVAGETYYVEVTATGLSGRTESKTISVPIPAPRRGSVISVK